MSIAAGYLLERGVRYAQVVGSGPGRLQRDEVIGMDVEGAPPATEATDSRAPGGRKLYVGTAALGHRTDNMEVRLCSWERIMQWKSASGSGFRAHVSPRERMQRWGMSPWRIRILVSIKDRMKRWDIALLEILGSRVHPESVKRWKRASPLARV